MNREQVVKALDTCWRSSPWPTWLNQSADAIMALAEGERVRMPESCVACPLVGLCGDRGRRGDAVCNQVWSSLAQHFGQPAPGEKAAVVCPAFIQRKRCAWNRQGVDCGDLPCEDGRNEQSPPPEKPKGVPVYENRGGSSLYTVADSQVSDVDVLRGYLMPVEGGK